MNIFLFEDYRDALKALVQEKQIATPAFSFQRLAELVGIQKSYLSKVLHGRAELNSDQIYLIGGTFKLNEEQMEHLLTLVELSRTQLKERRERLLKKIRAAGTKSLNATQFVESDAHELSWDHQAEFYLSPWTQITLVALSIDRYAKNLSLLAMDLGIAESEIRAAVVKLIRLGFVKQAGSTFSVVNQKGHIPRDSPFFAAWRTQIRQVSQHKLQSTTRENPPFSFTVVFSATEHLRTRMQNDLLNYLKKIQKEVTKADSRDVFQMNLDLFTWTQS